MKRLTIILFILVAVLSPRAAAQQYVPSAYDVGHPGMIHLRTNLLYDALLLPSIGVETGFGQRWSAVFNVSFNWLKDDNRHRYWRILTTDAEVRLWLTRDVDAFRKQGFHVGAYGALYRYDLEFGGKGNMGDLHWGGGLAAGYALPIGRNLTLDLSVAAGYIGGDYKEYEPENSYYVWLADCRRNYFGPTKAEVTLVWHIELTRHTLLYSLFGKKGGGRW